jgi:hypothetical protein
MSVAAINHMEPKWKCTTTFVATSTHVAMLVALSNCVTQQELAMPS